MTRLEELVPGISVKGIVANDIVTIIAIKWYGDTAIEVTFKDSNGNPGNELIYRGSENDFEILENSKKWTFDGEPDKMRLVSEANRIRLAYLFDPYLAVHTSSIQPLPHQITAVYKEMLPKLPIRYVLADDPGAGKTIMTGLLIKEMMARGDLRRCLIVSPGNLVEQWQDELRSKFNISFDILTNERIEASGTGNVFNEIDLCIARLDKLSRNEDLKALLEHTEWDLIVCDEAHKLSATLSGKDVKKTQRYKLGELLSRIGRNFVMLTATPHNGKDEDFQLFLKLIDSDRFEGVGRRWSLDNDLKDVMRRLVKEELVKFDGTPLFPERCAYTVMYNMSPAELDLYQDVTKYVTEEFNRIDKLEKGGKKNVVGFALTILQRRLASSPEAIYQSIHRRRERLEKRLLELNNGKRQFSITSMDVPFDEDYDDLPDDEREEVDDELVDEASAARSMEELRAEIDTLRRLEHKADSVRSSGIDRKWEELSKLLQENNRMFNRDGEREKIIIFTEHRDTLNYLETRIKNLLGSNDAVVTIHGGMRREERRNAETLFKEDKDVTVMVATDAAGEGINLQRAHLMINYDLPWNPNRLEQRFGRIHRIGQTEVCHLWNLVSAETREGQVFQRLFEKINEEKNTLGGKVFDVLGKVTYGERPLRDLLIEAIRYGEDPEVRDRLHRVVDESLDTEALRKLIQERALTDDVLDPKTVSELKEEMERIEAHRLQPFFIRSFFVEAFKSLGGRIEQREGNRFEILNVPVMIRNRKVATNSREPIMNRYERVCFDKSDIEMEGRRDATLICPGHPLMEAVVDIICEKYADVMRRGSVLIDDQDENGNPRVLFYVESSIQDGCIVNGKNRIISRLLNFVEIDSQGAYRDAGFAPYLDYRPPTDDEIDNVRDFIEKQGWISDELSSKADEFAITKLIPRNLKETKDKRNPLIDKSRRTIKTRLTNEIQYWDRRCNELREAEAHGETSNNLNSENAARRADELYARLNRRMTELDEESRISALPPVIKGGILVIPKRLISRGGEAHLETIDREHSNKEIEMIAMEAVMSIERALGYEPRDVSMDKCGYDIESVIPADKRGSGPCLRFIEVKGRRADADSITVTKNEILTALNKPEESILAVVQVMGTRAHTTYYQNAFHEVPDFCANSVNYDLSQLRDNAKIILERDDDEKETH